MDTIALNAGILKVCLLAAYLQTFLLAHLVSSLGIGQLEPISSRRTWCANSIQWRIGYASCRRVQVKWKGWSSSPGMKAIDKGEIDREGRRKRKTYPWRGRFRGITTSP
uniref:hypothetical protein n=1 Tax=Pseudomonas aeruginosa TaxID=287 RepID=UPI00191CEAA4|nr:hypothetical protein [Pseudomonas aeruginosa]